jgi:carboxypeptidase Taq
MHKMSNLPDLLDRLKSLLREVMDLRHAAALIEWDERVTMPLGGASVHGEILATLHRLAHEQFTSDVVGSVLEALQNNSALDTDPDSDDARLIQITARDYQKAVRVPPTFVAEQARVVSAAQHVWQEARAAADFRRFEPHLSRVLDLKREYVSFFSPSDHPYDHLVHDFEPGMTTAAIKSLFDALRPRQVELVREAANGPAVDASFLALPYAESDVLAFAEEVVTAFGFDWTRGRQDRSAHPFATGIGPDDVRITTRFVQAQPFALLFGTMHEAGHALYEQGVSPSLNRTPLEGGTSLGVHESQSRLWENFVGRSLPFWRHFFPVLQARFPDQLGNITTDQFYEAVNRVSPSLIRVEADEATYNLHVMLRVELEMGLIEGAVQPTDLPELWRTRMTEYLGVTPTNDAEGVLQDIHWSAGLFGYFATYTLGNVIAAQLWDTFGENNPERDDAISRGDFQPLLCWLRAAIHQHGCKYEPPELIERVTGVSVDPEPYLRYLEGKYHTRTRQ